MEEMAAGVRFAAKPSGSKEFSGYVSGQGCYGYWWSSTPAPPYVSTVELNCLDNQVEIREDYDARDGFSVRCIRFPKQLNATGVSAAPQIPACPSSTNELGSRRNTF